MMIELRAVRVDTGGPDEEGRLVFVADRLVAVLVQLSDQHQETAGQWFLEHGFGRLDRPRLPVFADLCAAQRWIEYNLTDHSA
ncbi:MAG: hypothetical protein EOP14_03410 [Pseudomonas sp.]|nr:MAG: hypothetical protein EOP14_03410 [Pseudomonas sp.]